MAVALVAELLFLGAFMIAIPFGPAASEATVLLGCLLATAVRPWLEGRGSPVRRGDLSSYPRESDTVADGWRRLADDLAERAATTGAMPDGHRGELEKQLWMTTQLLTSPGGQWREPGGD
jgi:hypothetical protein